MLNKFLAKARATFPTLKLPDQPPHIEALLADIQSHSELAAKAALAGDWATVYRHRVEGIKLQAKLGDALLTEAK